LTVLADASMPVTKRSLFSVASDEWINLALKSAVLVIAAE
jgi:hypothetical protein